MNRNEQHFFGPGGRLHWGSYGFVAGILIGVLLGWFFHGFVGAFVRVAMVGLALLPLILVYIAWRKIVGPWFKPAPEPQPRQPGTAIEANGIVHGIVHEPRPQ